jgi:uncharacterized membrane protein
MGLSLISSGLWVRVDPEFRRYVDDTDNFNFLYAGAYVIICVGVVIKVVAILGCFGATKDNVCIIVTVGIVFYTSGGHVVSMLHDDVVRNRQLTL